MTGNKCRMAKLIIQGLTEAAGSDAEAGSVVMAAEVASQMRGLAPLRESAAIRPGVSPTGMM
jgi:hypothetical protein